MARSADRNRVVPGLVQLYSTLTSDALQDRHPLTREFIRERFARVRDELAAKIAEGQRAGRIAADVDAADAASLVIAASDGLQVQWLLEPGAVDVRRSLELLERLLPSGDGEGGG
nr:TetR family transcriptional regulator C-terminal domain-containing protein [Kineococcus aurantiacus]